MTNFVLLAATVQPPSYAEAPQNQNTNLPLTMDPLLCKYFYKYVCCSSLHLIFVC